MAVPWSTASGEIGSPDEREELDLLVADALVLELKAVSAFAPVDKAKMIAYLKATGRQLGLILNFHCAVLKDGIQRVIRS